MSKNLLHITKLDAFRQWLDEQGIVHRPGRGDYEVLQIQPRLNSGWRCVYARHHMPEHYTVDRRIDYLVIKFLKETKPRICPTCKSSGFGPSVLGPDRCTFCDGTEGGNPPSVEEWVAAPHREDLLRWKELNRDEDD